MFGDAFQQEGGIDRQLTGKSRFGQQFDKSIHVVRCGAGYSVADDRVEHVIGIGRQFDERLGRFIGRRHRGQRQQSRQANLRIVIAQQTGSDNRVGRFGRRRQILQGRPRDAGGRMFERPHDGRIHLLGGEVWLRA